MSKVLIEVYLPAQGQSYDVRIPKHAKIGEIQPLIESCLGKLAFGYYVADSASILCDGDNGEILQANLTIEEAGIDNGKKLILI